MKASYSDERREALRILGDANVGFASVTEGIDDATLQGQLALTMTGAFAEFFSTQLGRRLRRVEGGHQA